MKINQHSTFTELIIHDDELPDNLEAIGFLYETLNSFSINNKFNYSDDYFKTWIFDSTIKENIIKNILNYFNCRL